MVVELVSICLLQSLGRFKLLDKENGHYFQLWLFYNAFLRHFFITVWLLVPRTIHAHVFDQPDIFARLAWNNSNWAKYSSSCSCWICFVFRGSELYSCRAMLIYQTTHQVGVLNVAWYQCILFSKTWKIEKILNWFLEMILIKFRLLNVDTYWMKIIVSFWLRKPICF